MNGQIDFIIKICTLPVNGVAYIEYILIDPETMTQTSYHVPTMVSEVVEPTASPANHHAERVTSALLANCCKLVSCSSIATAVLEPISIARTASTSRQHKDEDQCVETSRFNDDQRPFSRITCLHFTDVYGLPALVSMSVLSHVCASRRSTVSAALNPGTMDALINSAFLVSLTDLLPHTPLELSHTHKHTVLNPQPPRNSGFQIFVRVLASKSVALFVDQSQSIESVKHKLQCLIDIPFQHQRLLFNGKQLQDAMLLSDYNVEKDSTLHLVLRLRGGSSSEEEQEETRAPVKRAAVKLPPYWPKDPTLWFAQVEAQFAIANLKSEQTRFHHVIASLSPDAAAEVRDLILKPPCQPYTKLKETLIARTSESASQRIKKALDATEVGDAKPSQILRVLEQQLDGMEANEQLLMQVFLQKLPVTVRSIVAANSDKMKPGELADLADRVYEHLPPSSIITRVSEGASSSANFETRMSRLESMMEKLLSHRSQSNSQHRHRSRSRGRFDPEGKLCYYHWRFQEKATKCTAPCQWKLRDPKNDKAM